MEACTKIVVCFCTASLNKAKYFLLHYAIKSMSPNMAAYYKLRSVADNSEQFNKIGVDVFL